ncbi:MAG: TIGR00341 family protein [Halobacteriaceae archaeon]
MRLVQVTIPTGKRDAVLGALDDAGVDYVLTDETSGREFTAVAHFPLPTEAVEPVLESLREAGLDDDAYTVVLDARTVISRRFDELEQQYAEEENGDRIAREELQSAARELAPSTMPYVVMTVVSAVIATAGLLLDSPAVVVGSMVIAPLIGPAMATAVGTVVDDRELFRRGVKLQVAGMALAVVAAAAFAAFLKLTSLVPPGLEVTAIPEVRERLAPDFLSLAVALGAGVAGVVSLSTGVSTALVGVMIAVALIPPAATVGIAVAWGLPVAGVSAGVLALVNGLSINLAALAVLWYQGYRPQRWFRESEARAATLKRGAVLAAGILVLSAFLGGVTLSAAQNSGFEGSAREAAAAAVAGADGFSLLDVRVEYRDPAPFRTPEEVVVTVGRPPGTPPGGLAADIAERIQRATGRDVRVEVRFVAVERAS